MRLKPGRSLVLALSALALTAAVATAGAGRNAGYSGHTVQGHEPIYLHVSGDARAVTVDVPFPPLFCQGGGGLERRITGPAAISAGGAFHGTITYEYVPRHRRNIKLYFSGRFSGRSVSGKVRAEYLRAPQCNGTTGYSARR